MPKKLKLKLKFDEDLSSNEDKDEILDKNDLDDFSGGDDDSIKEEEEDEQKKEEDDLGEIDYEDEEKIDENEGENEPEYDEDEKENKSHEDKYEESVDGDSENCVFKKLNENSDNELEYEDDNDYYDNTEVYNEDYVPDDQRETKPILTKYERIRILSQRTKQLQLGAKPMIVVNNVTDYEKALLELNNHVMPYFIVRRLPDGRKERWRVSELKVIN